MPFVLPLLGLLWWIAPVTPSVVRSDQPCYVAITFIVADSATRRIQRVVTTGVRRFRDTGNGLPASCSPVEEDEAEAMRRDAEALAGAAPAGTLIDRLAMRGTSADFVTDHLIRIERRARENPAFEGVEVLSPDSGGREPAPLPAFTSGAARTRCVQANDALEKRRARYRWAC